jgi:hypothetical protein
VQLDLARVLDQCTSGVAGRSGDENHGGVPEEWKGSQSVIG